MISLPGTVARKSSGWEIHLPSIGLAVTSPDLRNVKRIATESAATSLKVNAEEVELLLDLPDEALIS